MAPFVLCLMYILAPVAWPTAQLLDYLLGEDHGTVYKKAGLKTLVDLHQTMGEASHQLNSDEVTIISAVLDLKEKSVGSIMTPMDDVFTLSADDVLNEETMDMILSEGYSRVPIHSRDNEKNFIGMLLVKMLITYDPEDCKPVNDFALATLPETRAETSCLDIVNFFQEGKSHMVLVSDQPGEDHGALGVVTLEDVIEALIGEEIVDESDVFVDVHKAIRRLTPAPRMRIPKGQVVAEQASSVTPKGQEGNLIDIGEDVTLLTDELQRKPMNSVPNHPTTNGHDHSSSPRRHMSYVRRRSSGGSHVGELRAPRRSNTGEIREQLKHLGPSNLASRPKSTRWASVKIKPGSSADMQAVSLGSIPRGPEIKLSEASSPHQGGIGEGLLQSAGIDAKDGVQALQQGYGGTSTGSPLGKRPASSTSKGGQSFTGLGAMTGSDGNEEEEDDDEGEDGRVGRLTQKRRNRAPASIKSQSTVRSLLEPGMNCPPSKSPRYTSKGPARSGSITENVVDYNGIRKLVLEMTSNSSNDEDSGSADKGVKLNNKGDESLQSGKIRGGGTQSSQQDSEAPQTKKKKRRRRRKKAQGTGQVEDEPPMD
jgi:metal transporter CNNM